MSAPHTVLGMALMPKLLFPQNEKVRPPFRVQGFRGLGFRGSVLNPCFQPASPERAVNRTSRLRYHGLH